MRLNNPFSRKEKRNEIPLSLFPASKMTRTSMQIGRAVPIYSCDMMAGNRISVDISQLTRFSTLKVPVMSNYEVEFGAYFVPYVALDGFFNSSWMKHQAATDSAFAAKLMQNALDANYFFDPASDDSLRKHPITVPMNILSGTNLIGSLADHLGYYTGADDSDPIVSVYSNEVNPVLKFGSFSSLVASPLQVAGNTFIFDDSSFLKFNATYSATTMGIVPLDLYAFSEFVLKRKIDPSMTNAEFGALRNIITIQSGSDYLIATQYRDAFKVIWSNLYSNGLVTPDGSWKDYFGDVTMEQVFNAWYNYVYSKFILQLYGSYEANVIRYLAYMRIYGDWFLNENYIKRDDFFDIVGSAYIRASEGLTLRGAYDPAVNFKFAIDNGYFKAFAEYLRNGECLPVLWQKDEFTAVLPSTDKAMSDWKQSGDGAADTPVGTTIREHYFNRMFQRFKDLVNRMGFDTKKNMQALYGAGPDDAALRRSQKVGFYSTTINIGDIAQTSSGDESSQLGQFAGVGISRDRTSQFDWTAENHGIFMILCWVRPSHVAIATAVDRSILKKDYYDYLNPIFGGIGYQDVKLRQVFPKTLSDGVFGKEEIYREYMDVKNEVSGTMRTVDKHWNSDRFVDGTTLMSPSNDSYKFLLITEDDDCNRVFMDEVTDPIKLTCFINGNVTRQLPEHIQLDF